MNCLSRFSRRQRMEVEYYIKIHNYNMIVSAWIQIPGYRYMMMYYLVFSGQVGRLHRISTDL